MALPALAKTWQFVSNGTSCVNQPIASLGSIIADNRRLLRSIKNALTGFASNPWTVRYSCNTTTAGTAGDGVDRWATDADLAWATTTSGARSWIVLRQTGIATNFEVCLDLVGAGTDSTNGLGGQLFVSASAGFTGGTTTARPTATDESAQALSGSGVAVLRWSQLTADLATRWSVMQSSDGACTRFWFYAAGVLRGFYMFDKPTNIVTGWTNPSYALAAAGTSTAATAGLANVAAYVGRFRALGINGAMAMGCETAGTVIFPSDANAGAVPNDIDGSWPMLPIGLSSSSVGVKGRHGTLADIWLGSNTIPDGDTYPLATTDFVQVGSLILPWNGGPVNLA
jgi:hypothetical protein